MTPGQVVTAALSGGVGAEKDKVRPVVVLRDHGRTVLGVALTDARKTRIPTHALIRGYTSGTQVKDALVTTEHAWSLDPSRITPRPDARPLTRDELVAVGRCFRLAVGLTAGRAPPAPPKFARGDLVEVDFSGAVGAEASGQTPAVVLSNDVGNYFGRTLLVAPILPPAAAADAVLGCPCPSGTLDLGRLRIVDMDRVVSGPTERMADAVLAEAARTLAAVVP